MLLLLRLQSFRLLRLLLLMLHFLQLLLLLRRLDPHQMLLLLQLNLHLLQMLLMQHPRLQTKRLKNSRMQKKRMRRRKMMLVRGVRGMLQLGLRRSWVASAATVTTSPGPYVAGPAERDNEREACDDVGVDQPAADVSEDSSTGQPHALRVRPW